METVFDILKKILRFVRFLTLTAVCIAAVVVLAASAIPYFGTQGYLADQCSQLRVAFLSLFLVLLIPSVVLRSLPVSCLALFGAVLNLVVILPFYFPANGNNLNASSAMAANDVQLMTINLYGAKNHNSSEVVKYIKKKKPDLVCFNEFNNWWMKRLDEDIPEYKYRIDEHVFGGSAIYSKVPLGEVVSNETARVKRYGVRATVGVGGKSVMVLAEHPSSPQDRKRWINRNEELQRLANECGAVRTPLVLIGDLNTTPWSPYFRQLIEKSGLKDTEQGYGLQASWSTRMRPLPPMVPIDHCLISNDFAVLERSLGPNIGSDHLPVFVKLRLL